MVGTSAGEDGPAATAQVPAPAPKGGEKRSAARAELTRTLEGRIRRGEYAPGTWLPTERSLAGEFDVDRSTVRAALTDLAKRGMVVRIPGRRPWVSDEYRPDGAADIAAPRKPAVDAIAAILPQHPIYPAAQSILRGVSRTLRQHEASHRLLIFDTQDDASRDASAERERRALETVAADGVGAVLLWHVGGDTTLSLALRLQSEAGVALVFVDRCPEGVGCDFVGVDNRAAARAAVERLLALGHRRIACVSDGSPASTVRERIAGHREALVAHGLPADLALVQTVSPEFPVGAALATLLALPDPPTAVFTINDIVAHGVIIEAERRSLRVPEDLSVIGFDDLEQYSPRPALLTTVRQPFERIGERAAELILRRHAAPDGAATTAPAFQHVLLPAPLVERSTTGLAPVASLVP
jgi:LacI family transcriptional regulator